MAQSNRKFYRDNGAAAYDVYAWNDQAARQYDDNRAYERTLPTELPDEQVREQPYRRVKAKTTVAPFTLAGMLTVACLMILVIFGYVQLFEASSNVSRLETQLANLKDCRRGIRGRDRPDQVPARADRLCQLLRD